MQAALYCMQCTDCIRTSHTSTSKHFELSLHSFPPRATYSSLRKSKALLLSLGSCCRVVLLFLTDGWI